MWTGFAAEDSVGTTSPVRAAWCATRRRVAPVEACTAETVGITAATNGVAIWLEEAPVGDSASNSLGESAERDVKAKTRTIKLTTEGLHGVTISMGGAVGVSRTQIDQWKNRL